LKAPVTGAFYYLYVLKDITEMMYNKGGGLPMSEEFLSESEVNELRMRIVNNEDEEAWDALCENYRLFVQWCVKKRLAKLETLTPQQKNDMRSDLVQAGWRGFVEAVPNYKEDNKSRFTTYCKKYIDGEISKELSVLLNRTGVTEKPALKRSKSKSVSRQTKTENESKQVHSANRRALQMLEVLRLFSDEDHSMTQAELRENLQEYRLLKYGEDLKLETPLTISGTLEALMQECDIKARVNEGKGRKAPEITDLQYVHLFSNEQLDELIQLICFSEMISEEEKSELIAKLLKTASLYYETPFWDGSKLKFNSTAVYGRFSGKGSHERSDFSENVKRIQRAINSAAQISFTFNRYNEDHVLVPKGRHKMSPYRLVVYHDNFYCIGLREGARNYSHYRVDLMSDVDLVLNEDGSPVPIRFSNFEGIPICNSTWDPARYMAEHLNMAYDTQASKPRDILIKIKDTDYTILHDWFGNHYEKTSLSDEPGYDIVRVKTSPSMLVHWAMQYGTSVEIMDKKIRESIRNEIRALEEMYG
jgi:hypothetical protein